jgi:hypothetical protein
MFKKFNSSKWPSKYHFTYRQKWEDEFLLTLGDHIVAVGFACSFSPYAF